MRRRSGPRIPRRRAAPGAAARDTRLACAVFPRPPGRRGTRTDQDGSGTRAGRAALTRTREVPHRRRQGEPLEGRPAHVLVPAAGGAGLLVVGRRRRRAAVGLHHPGPVAHALIHHVHCPVVLVPHD
ncbi:universal stress protein [Streptomyces sp. KR55]|uniref:universal stress protein n=1 Tax=Streptomyces sp. KR55 TaxID=3457425 RepID=UPI003FD30761